MFGTLIGGITAFNKLKKKKKKGGLLKLKNKGKNIPKFKRRRRRKKRQERIKKFTRILKNKGPNYKFKEGGGMAKFAAKMAAKKKKPKLGKVGKSSLKGYKKKK